MTYTVLDLFRGAGGLHLAAEISGDLKTIAFSEIDPYASATLARRWPTVPNLGDITMVREFPDADIICGGFPCQDISVGSHTKTGIRGSRSGLWVEMFRAITQVQPSGVLIENSNQLPKKGLDIVLYDLASAGYDAEWYTVTASSIGAPHKRERTCVVAYRQRQRGGGLGTPFDLVQRGSWEWTGDPDLRQIFDSPFLASTRWPQPLLRGMDDGVAGRVHRLRQIGNGVVPQLFSQLFDLLKWRIK